jgi:hypothetical protein
MNPLVPQRPSRLFAASMAVASLAAFEGGPLAR